MIPIPANLRINADDFGLSASASRGIADAIGQGRVNSISVTPLFDSESEARLRDLAAQPELRIGAHLTFLEVPLLTRPKAFRDGLPPPNYRAFLRAYGLGKIGLETVYQEWRAQILLLRGRIGRKLSHLDSHQHLHVLPRLWPALRRLQTEFEIPCVRVPWESTLRALAKDAPFGLALQVLARWRRRAASEIFFGVGASMGFTADAFRNFARQVALRPNRNFELMIHPDASARGRRESEELGRWLEMLAEEIRNRS